MSKSNTTENDILKMVLQGTIQQAGLWATDNDLNYVVASSIDTIYAAG